MVMQDFLFTSMSEPRVSTDLTDFTEGFLPKRQKSAVPTIMEQNTSIKTRIRFYSTKNLKSITA
jgi:hypothetical protein